MRKERYEEEEVLRKERYGGGRGICGRRGMV